MSLEYDPNTGRMTLNGVELNIAPWQANNIDALTEDRWGGAPPSWVVVGEMGDTADLDPRWFGFEGVEYDGEAWIDPAKWDACVDDGARVLRCGHCGESTAFNVRDHLDVLCEGCGTTYMARPVE